MRTAPSARAGLLRCGIASLSLDAPSLWNGEEPSLERHPLWVGPVPLAQWPTVTLLLRPSCWAPSEGNVGTGEQANQSSTVSRSPEALLELAHGQALFSPINMASVQHNPKTGPGPMEPRWLLLNRCL